MLITCSHNSLIQKIIELGILFSIMPTVWKDNDGCTKQYRCDLIIYFTTVLTSLYRVIIYPAIYAPGHGNNVVVRLDATEKLSLKREMECFGKLASNDTSKVGILPSASKYYSIIFQNNIYTSSLIITG